MTKKKGILLVLGLIILAASWPGYRLYDELVRLKSDDPLVWEKDIEAFELLDAQGNNPANPVVFVGSSSIRFWDSLTEDMAPIPVIRRGFGGAKLNDVVHYADRIVSVHDPVAVVIFAGSNDVTPEHSKPPQALLNSFKAFIGKVRRDKPSLPVYYIAITPSILRWEAWSLAKQANELIREHAEQDEHLYVIDTSEALMGPDGTPEPDNYMLDRLHLNDNGYAIWTRMIKPYLSAYSLDGGLQEKTLSQNAESSWLPFEEGVTYQVIEPGDKQNIANSKEVIGYDTKITLEDGTPTEAWGSTSESAYLAASLFSMDAMPIPLLADMVVGESRVYRLDGNKFEKEKFHPGQPRLVTLTVLGKQAQLAAPQSVDGVPEEAIPLPEDSGFIYLARGADDDQHPSLTDDIKVHYTGWNSAGEMFDSSALKGEPATFPLGRLIKGYQTLLPKMVRGDKVRAWFTSDMAYGHRPQYKPLQGTLVFEIELLDFKPGKEETGD